MSDPDPTPTATPSEKTPKKPAPRRTWRRRLLAVLFGFVFAVILAELALRAIGYSSPSFLRTHPIYGAAFKPGIEGWFRLEGKAWNSINSHGFNGPEWTTEKPANTFRIVVLGDSFVAAQQVEQKDSFCQRLQHNLQTSGKLGQRKVEVLNCGCNGYGTAQELLVWREQARHFQADLVLLAFLPANDLNDNHRPLATERPMRPYFILNAQDQLELDQSFLEDHEFLSRQSWSSQIKYFFVEHLRLAQLVNTFRLKNAQAPNAVEPEAKQQAPLEVGLNDQAYQTPRGEWIKAWDITRRLIRLLEQEVLASGSKFAVVCLTMGPQLNPDLKAREKFAARLGMADLLEPDRILSEVCKTSAPPIPFLSLAPEMQKIAAEQQVVMHGFGNNLNGGHWNENGHRYAAKLIAEWLEAKPELLQAVENKSK